VTRRRTAVSERAKLPTDAGWSPDTADVRLYNKAVAVCCGGPKSLADLQACATRMVSRQGIGLRINMARRYSPLWPRGPTAPNSWIFWQRHRTLVAEAASRVLFPDLSRAERLKSVRGLTGMRCGLFITVCIGPATPEELARAARARKAAASRLASLGYVTTMIDDDGGRVHVPGKRARTKRKATIAP